MTQALDIAIIGGGPAGLMAAEILSAAAPRLRPILEAYPPEAVMAWAEGLGQPTYVGSSGRIFPKAMKASPLLRAWLTRLARAGVQFRTRHEWIGWDESGPLLFRRSDNVVDGVAAGATVLALGGASWPRLGADGSWARILDQAGVAVTPLRPANCGIQLAWSAPFRERFQGMPLKRIRLGFAGQSVMGEAVVTAKGLEGGAVYGLVPALREAIAAEGRAMLTIDLKPDVVVTRIAERLQATNSGDSLANRLRKVVGLPPVAINLMREAGGKDLPRDSALLAERIKSLQLTVTGTEGLARAISTAGGVAFEALDESLMIRTKPGVYVAGEMIDWEAPTGGYLLQACLASGVAAARAILQAHTELKSSSRPERSGEPGSNFTAEVGSRISRLRDFPG